MKTDNFRKPEYILILAVFILLLVLSFLSQGYYGGADNINHYFLARYSFAYPKLFLDPWGRPLYTILSSPFAQFGFKGIKVFNVILGTLSAWLLMKTARKLKVSSSWMAIIIVCFTPLYMVMLFTALTEILFSFVFICSIYLFFSKRYLASAIVISFIPFARTEGYFMIPFLFLGLLLRRQWKAIPFLGVGFVFFSILGAYQYSDLLWVIHKFPYPFHHPLYNTPGEFWSFFKQADITFGAPLLILLCLGIIMLLYNLLSSNREKRINAGEILLMFLLPVLGYYFFHSLMLYKAWGGSLGLIRYMAAIIPLASMITLYGFSLFSMMAGNRKWLRSVFTFLIIAAIIFFNFKLYKFPVPLGEEESQIKKAVVWVETHFNPVPLACYNDFNVPYFFDTDPFNSAKNRQLWTSGSLKNIPVGAVYIWDAHFGPNECQIPFDTVMRDPYMRLVKLFRPTKAFLTLGDYPYEVYVFRKNPVVNEFDNYFFIQTLINEEDKDFTPVFRKVFDFENASPDYESRITYRNVASGKRAFLMDGTTEYSPGLLFHCSDLPDREGKIRVKVSAKLYSDVPFTNNPSILVISLEDKKGSYCYKALYAEKTNFAIGKWNQAFLNADLPKIRSKDDVIKVYIWHPGKKDLILDDLIIDILAAGKDPE